MCHGESVACDNRCDIRGRLNTYLPNQIEIITFDVLMPLMKPVTTGIIYRVPNQDKFNGIFGKNLVNLK